MENANRLKLLKMGSFWAIIRCYGSLEASIAAEIHLDHWEQTDQILIAADAAEEVVLDTLRLAASHVRQYARNRRVAAFGGLMVAEYGNHNLTEADSDKAMDFDLIDDEIRALDRETIEKELDRLDIEVLTFIQPVAEYGLMMAMDILRVDCPALTYDILPQRSCLNDRIRVKLTIRRPSNQNFTFWKDESRPRPGQGFDLHVVPSYHPVMYDKREVGLINGATDCLIRGKAVRCIYAPEEARTVEENFGGSWNRVNHPFYATGTIVELGLIGNYMRTEDGVKRFVEVVRGMLGLDNTYVAVSGGFNPPLKCAHNRLLELGQLDNSPWPRAPRPYQSGKHVARGSEAHCVWAHRVLTEEGVIDDSYVPQWLYSEGWLGLYETAEVQHGLY